jgi:hypothetical protein
VLELLAAIAFATWVFIGCWYAQVMPKAPDPTHGFVLRVGFVQQTFYLTPFHERAWSIALLALIVIVCAVGVIDIRKDPYGRHPKPYREYPSGQ